MNYISKTLITASIALTSLLANAQLGGTYTIGPSSSNDFSCITCTGGLFDSLNAHGRYAAVVARITGDLSAETGQHALMHDTTGFQVLIAPSAAVLRTITYSGAGGILIDLDGADNLTIDGRFGGAGRYLRWVSADSANPVIQINNDAKNFTLRNCIIESNNASKFSYSAGAIISRSYGQSGNDTLHILDNLIRFKDTPAMLREGLHLAAPAQTGQKLSGLKIMGNEFDGIQGISVNIEGDAGEIPNILLSGNSFYASQPVRGGNDGELTAFVSVNSGGGHTLTANYFGGTAAKCSGNKASVDMLPASSLLYFLWLGPGCTGSGTHLLDSNIFDLIDIRGSLSVATSVSLIEIHPQVADSVKIGHLYGNFFGNSTASASALANSRIFVTERFNSPQNGFRVIRCMGTGAVSVRKNKIGGILMEHNSALGMDAKLISVSGATSATITANQIGGNTTDNIVKRCNGDFMGLDIASRGRVDSNWVRGIKAINFFSGTFRAISVFTTGGSYFIRSNTVGANTDAVSNPSVEVSHNSAVSATLYGLQVFGQGADSVVVTDNQFGSIFCTSDSLSHPRLLKLMSVGTGVLHKIGISKNSFGNNSLISVLQHSPASFKVLEVIQPDCPEVLVSENSLSGLRTGGFFSSAFSGIHLQGKSGQKNTFAVENNSIGDTATNALLSASVFINSKNTGTADGSDLIAIEEANNYSVIRNNHIGGIYLLDTFAAATNPFFAIRAGGSRDSLIITGNKIGSHNTGNNILIESQTGKTFLIFAGVMDGSIKNEINQNTVSNILLRGTFDNEVTAIRAAFGNTALSSEIKNNRIRGFKAGDNGNHTAFKGIWCENRNADIQNNSISAITVTSTYSGGQFTGIWLNAAGGDNLLSGNVVTDIHLASFTSTETDFTGWAVEGAGADISVTANRLHSVRIDAIGTGSIFKGILLNDARSILVANNLILYRHNTNNDVSVFGIYDFSRSGDQEIFHNTAALYGRLPKTMRRYTAAYYKTNGANRTLKNNVFYNALGDGQGNYTVFAANNQGNFFADYNFHYTEDHADSMMFYNDASHMTHWRKQGFGKFSMHPPRGQYLIDSLTGQQLSFILNDKADATTGIVTDLQNNMRPLGSGPDLGAFELSSSGLSDGLTGKDDQTFEALKHHVYPNPAARGTWIQFGKNAKGEIRDMQGRTIVTLEGIRAWKADVGPGLYLFVPEGGEPLKITIH